MTQDERADFMAKVASELVGYAEDLIRDSVENGQRVEFMAECFSEALLGLFKCYLIMNPQVATSQFLDSFYQEMEERLEVFFTAPDRSIN